MILMVLQLVYESNNLPHSVTVLQLNLIHLLEQLINSIGLVPVLFS